MMRWRFPDLRDLVENQGREDMLDRIDAWWREFSAQADAVDRYFTRGEGPDVAEWTSRALDRIDPRLMFEYGPAVRGRGHRLCITCEVDRMLRPLVDHILSQAPKIDGWEFYPYRLREDAAMATSSMVGRVGLALDSDCRISVQRGQYNQVDLLFALSTEQALDQRASNAAFVAAEALLGEETLDHWIGAIEVSEERIEGGVPLDGLQRAVQTEIDAIVDSLDPRPHAERFEGATWTSLSATPTEADDYPRWNDLYVATTMNKDLWFAAHQASIFSSRRFSRCGELFAYVKLDGAHWPEDGPDRFTLEDAIHADLGARKLGSVVGGGTGLRYSYIDLALIDPDRSLDVVAETLRREGAGRRSWILFFDDDLAGEWVGVYPDTPQPFGLPS